MLRNNALWLLRSYRVLLGNARCYCGQPSLYEPRPERLAQINESQSGWVPPSENKPQLNFSIRRTRTNNLPVYTNVQNSGTKAVTIIRKVSGDLKELEKCLRFRLGDDKVYQINELTSCVKVKGCHAKEITKLLLELGY